MNTPEATVPGVPRAGVFARAFAALRARPRDALLAAAVYVIPAEIVVQALQGALGDSGDPLERVGQAGEVAVPALAFVPLLVTVVLLTAAGAAVVRVVAAADRGHDEAWGVAAAEALPRVVPLLLVSLLTPLLAFAAALPGALLASALLPTGTGAWAAGVVLLGGVPALLVVARLAAAVGAIVLEGCGPLRGLARSVALLRGRTVRTAGRLLGALVLSTLAGAVALLALLPVTAVGGFAVRALAGAVVSILGVALFQAALTTIYVQAREAAEPETGISTDG